MNNICFINHTIYVQRYLHISCGEVIKMDKNSNKNNSAKKTEKNNRTEFAEEYSIETGKNKNNAKKYSKESNCR